MNPEKVDINPKASTQEQGEDIKSPQEIAWEEKRTEVDQLADRLGLGIDEKIKESVTAFLVHGFTTCGSCEGHIAEEGEDQHGYPFPWIEINAPEPEGWDKAKVEKKRQLGQEWLIKNLEQQRKMMSFLEEFYLERETSFEARLIFERGGFGRFRVQSFGADLTFILSLEERKQKLALYQKEMSDFTDFLKNKHLSKV